MALHTLQCRQQIPVHGSTAASCSARASTCPLTRIAHNSMCTLPHRGNSTYHAPQNTLGHLRAYRAQPAAVEEAPTTSRQNQLGRPRPTNRKWRSTKQGGHGDGDVLTCRGRSMQWLEPAHFDLPFLVPLKHGASTEIGPINSMNAASVSRMVKELLAEGRTCMMSY